MKYLITTCLVISACWLEAQTVEWLTPTEHNFGEIPQRHFVTYDFKFKNTSGMPLQIDNVRTTCGCTAPTWSYTSIRADSTSVIKVEYDAKKYGYFRKKVKVYFDGVSKPETLWIEGEVVE